MKRLSSILVLALLPLLSFAQDVPAASTTSSPATVFITVTATPTAAASTVQPAAPTQSINDGGPAPAGGVGSNDGSPDDVNAGSEGPDTGAITLSKGAIAAISTVVAVVAVIGIASAILFFVAKKRQWEVRASLRRASKKFTSGLAGSRSRRQSRAQGVRMASPPPSKLSKPADKPRPTTGVREVKDVEKGLGTNTKITSQFEVETPMAKSWTDKLMRKGGAEKK